MPLVLSGDGAVGPLSATEIGFLDGVTSSVQTQINSKVSSNTVGMVPISSGSLAGASIVISSISQAYENLVLMVRAFQPVTDSTSLQLRVNADATASRHLTTNAVTLAATAFADTSWTLTGVQDSAIATGFVTTTIYDYTNTVSWKFAVTDAITNDSTTATSLVYRRNAHAYNQVGAVTSIVLLPFAGNFTAGSYTLYGVN